MYTDHAACLSILNTAKPSGKLARWALTIHTNADALSRCPVDENLNSTVAETTAVLSDLEEVQRDQLEDLDLATMMMYLQDGTLPEEEKQARKIVIESKQFELVEGVLYHENSAFPDRWCDEGRPSRSICRASFREESL